MATYFPTPSHSISFPEENYKCGAMRAFLQMKRLAFLPGFRESGAAQKVSLEKESNNLLCDVYEKGWASNKQLQKLSSQTRCMLAQSRRVNLFRVTLDYLEKEKILTLGGGELSNSFTFWSLYSWQKKMNFVGRALHACFSFFSVAVGQVQEAERKRKRRQNCGQFPSSSGCQRPQNTEQYAGHQFGHLGHLGHHQFGQRNSSFRRHSFLWLRHCCHLTEQMVEHHVLVAPLVVVSFSSL